MMEEYENLAEYEKLQPKLMADVVKLGIAEKMTEVIENWHSQEIWKVVE